MMHHVDVMPYKSSLALALHAAAEPDRLLR
jgi:hypothetical protein